MENRINMKKISGDFTVCKVSDYSKTDLNAEYCFAGKTDEENSLVCLTDDAPSNVLQREDGWKAFRIEGVLDFSLIGVIADISALLARKDIGIFVVSTYNTDYVFVKKENVSKALLALKERDMILYNLILKRHNKNPACFAPG